MILCPELFLEFDGSEQLDMISPKPLPAYLIDRKYLSELTSMPPSLLFRSLQLQDSTGDNFECFLGLNQPFRLKTRLL